MTTSFSASLVTTRCVRPRWRRRLPRAWRLLALVAVLPLLGASAASAGLQINLTYQPTVWAPTADPNGLLLTSIMEAAASHWETILLDDHTLDVLFLYQDIGDSRLAFACFMAPDGQCLDGSGSVGNTLPTEAIVVFDTIKSGQEVLYFYDPTPMHHSEFDFQHTLYRDLGASSQGLLYNGAPPDLLEVSYRGDATAEAPAAAQDGFDLLSVALHELGHTLGMLNEFSGGETQDGDFDVNPDFVDDAVMSVEVGLGGDTEHLRSGNSLMGSSMASGRRYLPTATDVFALAAAGGWQEVALPRREFWGGSFWSLAANWAGDRVPTNETDVFVRGGNDAHMVADVALRHLTVADDGEVLAYGHDLQVEGWLTVKGGQGLGASQLWAEGDVVAGLTLIDDGGEVQVDGGHLQTLMVETRPGGKLSGFGNATMWALDNNGSLRADAGGPMIVNTLDGSLDLDGSDETGSVEAVDGEVRLADGLSDAFDGAMTVHGDAMVNVMPGWTLGPAGLLALEGGIDGGHLARVHGGDLQVDGAILASGWSSLTTDVVFSPSSSVAVDDGGALIMEGTVELAGGSYSGQGMLRFEGATTVTSWTHLQTQTVDLDGQSGNTAWELQNRVLELSVESLDRYNNTFDGSLYFNGLSARLLVQLDDPSEAWTMAGSMETEANSFFVTTMLGGSDVDITGSLEVDGMTRLATNVRLSGDLTTVDGDAVVQLGGDGKSIFWRTAEISGAGDVEVLGGTILLLEHGFDDWLHLVNYGEVQPGVGLGSVQVWTYTQGAGGTLGVDIGGLTPGSEHDRLRALGSMQLDGGLEVQLANGFVPQVGDSFEILSTTFGTVAGTWDPSQIILPTLSAKASWRIHYGLKSVTLEVLARR